MRTASHTAKLALTCLVAAAGLLGGSLAEQAEAAGTAPVTTSLTSSANPVGVGQQVSYKATVVSRVSGKITGTVTFTNGSSTIPGCGSVALSSSTAICTATYTTVGSRQVTAKYNGNTTYAPSSATYTEQVNATAPPRVGLVLSRGHHTHKHRHGKRHHKHHTRRR